MSLEKMRATSSVAWFKLAEVIMRGEKERALSIYRLLMHSVHNDAIKVQLEGDILLMFNDYANAHQVYAKAAFLHQKNNDRLQAYMLYEQILQMLLALDQKQQAYESIGISPLSRLHQAKLYEKLIMHLMHGSSSGHSDLLKQVVARVVALYLHEEATLLSRFMTKLASSDTTLHNHACECASGTS